MVGRGSERRWAWARFASFVAVAVAVIGPKSLVEPWQVAGKGIDLPGTIWIHWWVRTTLEALELPITTNLLFYPDGKNFFADTGANYVDAYVGVPLQWLFGVPGFLDPLGLVILVGNALAFYALARDVTDGKAAPAWAATIAFLVNPFLLRQLGEGRPTQALLWFVLLAVRYGLRIRTGTTRDAALFGAHTALAALTYWYNAYFILFGLFPYVLWELARAPKLVAPRVALAVGVTLAICSPFLLGIAHELASGAVRRLAYTNWGDGPAAAGSRWRTPAGDLAATTWLAAAALGAAAWRRSWPLLLGVGVTLVMAAGGRIDLTEPALTNWPFVFLWENLPLYPRLGFPERVTVLTFTLLALGAAAGLARLDAVWAPLFALVALGERAWSATLPLPHTSYHDQGCTAIVRENPGPVIMFPLATSESGMVLQTGHGSPMFGGMGEREPDLRPAAYDARIGNSFLIMLGATLNMRHAPIGYTPEDREAITSVFRWAWYDTRFTPPFWGQAGYHGAAVVAHMRKELGEPFYQDERCVLFDLHAPAPERPPGRSTRAKMASDELVKLGISNVDASLRPAEGTLVPAAGPVAPGAIGVPVRADEPDAPPPVATPGGGPTAPSPTAPSPTVPSPTAP